MGIDPDVVVELDAIKARLDALESTSLESRVSRLEMATFPVFDDMLFDGKPSAEELGLPDLQFLSKARYSFPNGQTEPPDRTHTRGMGVQQRGMPSVHDLELWHGEAYQVDRYVQISSDFNEGFGEGVTGHYGVLPKRDYWRATKDKTDPDFIAWQQENDAWVPLIPHVTAAFPSLYTFYEDQDGWELYARRNVEETRRLAPDLPCYPYLWPYYHNAAQPVEIRNTLIPPDYWRRQLELMKEIADGLVIWGGWQQPWDETAPWWLETKDFMGMA